jgi:hypothetical protein
MYPLMEKHEFAGGMQEQAISQIERAKPAYMLLVNNNYSWSVSAVSDKHIFNWFDGFAAAHYEVEGYVDKTGIFDAEYRWGRQKKGFNYKEIYRITVFKRID